MSLFSTITEGHNVDEALRESSGPALMSTAHAKNVSGMLIFIFNLTLGGTLFVLFLHLILKCILVKSHLGLYPRFLSCYWPIVKPVISMLSKTNKKMLRFLTFQPCQGTVMLNETVQTTAFYRHTQHIQCEVYNLILPHINPFKRAIMMY